MTKQDPERRLELSPAQVAGSALAAMSGAVFISWAGTAGTLIGAAAGSVIATVGSATYTWSLRRSRDAARRTAERMRQTALVANGRPRSVAETTTTVEEPPGRRWDLPWGKVALASLAVMVAGMAGITAVEAVTGRSVSSYTGGGDSSSTTLGSVVGSGQQATKEHATKPTKVTPTETSTPTPDPGTEAAPTPAVPAPSTPATPAPTTDPTPTPSVPPAVTADPGTGTNGQ
jgi:hypothetical protein